MLLRFADMLEWVKAAIAMSLADCLWKVKHGACKPGSHVRAG